MRLFIAINIDSSLRDPLAALQARLKQAEAPVRWVKPEHLHFTLKFLGPVPEARLAALREALRSSLAGVTSFPLSLERLGTFPPKGRPRVVWVGVGAGAGEMGRIRERIDTTLLPLGFPREGRPFQPHLTLGRVKEAGRVDRLLEELRTVPIGEISRMQVPSVELMHSQLHPAGAVHTVIDAVPLVEAT